MLAHRTLAYQSYKILVSALLLIVYKEAFKGFCGNDRKYTVIFQGSREGYQLLSNTHPFLEVGP